LKKKNEINYTILEALTLYGYATFLPMEHLC